MIVGVAEVTFSEDLDGYEKVQRTQQLVRKTWFQDEICWNDQDEIDEPEDLEYLVAVSSCKPDMLHRPELYKQCVCVDYQASYEAIAITELSDGEQAANCCRQALPVKAGSSPGITSASSGRSLITISDLEVNLAEQSPLPCKIFKCFLRNSRVASRRDPICEELERVTGLEKVNRVRLSLWHLWKELKLFSRVLLSERLKGVFSF